MTRRTITPATFSTEAISPLFKGKLADLVPQSVEEAEEALRWCAEEGDGPEEVALHSKRKLAQATKARRLLQAREDPNAFAEYAFEDSVSGRSLTQATIHRELQAAIHDESTSHTMVEFPRNHGKTTQCEIGVLFLLGKNPNLRFKFVCESDNKAQERVQHLAQHITHNKRLREVFPHLRPAQRGDWCVPLDASVHMADGRQILAGDVQPGDRVWGRNPDQRIMTGQIEDVSGLVYKPCVFMRTETGRTLRVSADHRILTGHGFKRAGDVEAGEGLAVGRGMGPGEGADIDTREARLLGYLTGDGYLATKLGGPIFSNGDPDIAQDFRGVVSGLGYRSSTYRQDETITVLGMLGGERGSSRDFLRFHKMLGCKSATKTIPEVLFQGGRGVLADFFLSYFACDGCLDESVDRLSITTMSPALARGIRRVFRLFGVCGRTHVDGRTGAYKVGVAGWDAVQLVDSLFAVTGPSCQRIERLQGWSKKYKANHDPRVRRSDLVCEGRTWRRRTQSDPPGIGWEKVQVVEGIGVLPCVDFQVERPVDTFLVGEGFVAHNTKKKIVVQRSRIMRDVSIEACGIQTAATGGRADYLIADDPVGRRNALEIPKLRETIKTAWHSDWLNLLEPTGRVIYIYTPWHTADLSHQLKQNPVYKVFSRPVGPDLQPVWPEKWPRDRLKEKLAEVGQREFDRGYRLVALSGEYATVRPEWISYWKQDPSLGDYLVFTAYDLSTGEGDDYFASVSVGLDLRDLGNPLPRIVVLDGWQRKLTFLSQVGAVLAESRVWRPEAIALEAVQYQAVLPQVLQAAQDGAGLGLTADIIPIRPRLSKALRLAAVTPLLEVGKVEFNPALDPLKKHRPDLVDQLQLFPLAAHDDLVDAFVYAVALAVDYSIRAGASPVDVSSYGGGGTLTGLEEAGQALVEGQMSLLGDGSGGSQAAPGAALHAWAQEDE